MKHSYLLAGIKANRLFAMIARNGGVSLRHFPRFIFLLNAGIWSNIFSAVEKRKFKSKLKSFTPPNNPVIIVGNWRTGSTFLHQLLALDEQFTTPTVYNVSNPDHLLVSHKYYKPIMTKALGSKRPMDNVKIGIDEPQEDEYALLKLCKNTPLEDLIFGSANGNFLDTKNNFLPPDKITFSNALKRFHQKLSFTSNKTVLYKNPFHSLRIPFLKSTFPNARFIHIYRHPEKVIPSCQHMWNVVGQQNILKGKWRLPNEMEISSLYKHIVKTIRFEFNKLNQHQKAEIQFEKLKGNPIGSIKDLYKDLNIVFTTQFEDRLKQFCSETEDFKQNTYSSSTIDNAQIKAIFKDVLPEYYT